LNGEAERQEMARISVVDPVSRAIDWARDVLFRPFSFEKWIVLGFCAWLALLGDCGGGNASSNWKADERYHRGDFDEAWHWMLDHLMEILTVAGVVVCCCFAFWLLLVWISSRGKFMFLDGVVHNRAAVVEPWKRFRVQANSLFFLRVVLALAGLVAIVSILLIAGSVIWSRSEMHQPDPLVILTAVFAVLSIIAVAIVLALLGLVINDFLVPLMYLRGERIGAAWSEFRGLLLARPGAFILYVLVKIVIAIVVAVVGLIACCLTCCIVVLPYVGTVILLPIHVFRQAYPLYFLGQFGPQYARFAALGPELDAAEATTTESESD
jgi:hypothetical protein